MAADNPLAGNYLGAELLIKARLEERLKPLRCRVMSLVDAGQVKERSQLADAAFLLYEGDQMGDEIENGGRQFVEQVWTVLVGVRDLRSPNDFTSGRARAGELLLAAIEALSGWKAHRVFGHMARTAPRRSVDYYSPGYGEFPLSFTLPLLTRGVQ